MIKKVVYGYASSTIEKALKQKTTKAINGTINNLTKEAVDIIDDIKTAPIQIKAEVLRNISSHESPSTPNTFVRNANINNYDYFNEYYSNYNKRYSATPKPNLAELIRVKELNIYKLKHRMYR